MKTVQEAEVLNTQGATPTSQPKANGNLRVNVVVCLTVWLNISLKTTSGSIVFNDTSVLGVRGVIIRLYFRQFFS